jgi:hypothetical protein
MSITGATTGRFPSRGPRKALSQLIRDGENVAHFTSVPYYDRLGPLDAEVRCDPLLLAFVGKFGPRLLDEIMAEQRGGDPYVESRVWDREQVIEKVTRAINGGLPEVHRRLHEYPKLYAFLCEGGFRHSPQALKVMRGPQGVSVFRAIAYMTNPMFMNPAAIADKLEESRL